MSRTQSAYDAGHGRRDISHRSANPFMPVTEQEERDAYDKGFADRNDELVDQADRANGQ